MSYTKNELLNDVADRAGATRAEVEKVLESFFGTVVDKAKSGEKVTWPGFGAFSTSQRAARTGRNPQTGAEVQIPASTAMKFSAAKGLKDNLNNR